MSKGNSALKVLRTALKRVSKGWTKQAWHFFNKADNINYVCLEGAMFGYCEKERHGLTPAQTQARDIVLDVIGERYPGCASIPEFNDNQERTKEEVMEVLKLAMIKLETGAYDEEDEIDEKDFDDLLEFMDK